MQDLTALESELRSQLKSDPNSPLVIQGIQRLLASGTHSLMGSKMLFHVFLDERLNPTVRGSVVFLIINVIGKYAHLFDPKCIGFDPNATHYKAIYKGLKFHLDQAINELHVVRSFQDKTQTPITAPKFIIAVPKSGSSLLGICLGNMVKVCQGGDLSDGDVYAYRGYPSWWTINTANDWDLRPEVGVDPLFITYPGAVYKGHVNPLPKNFDILDLYEMSKYLWLDPVKEIL